MTTSARIEIVSSPRPLHIDRTLPSFLQDHLKSSEWEEFCNDVDTVLHPLDVSLEVCQIIFFGAVGLCVLGIMGVLFLSSYLQQAYFFLVVSIIFFLISNFVCALYLRFRLDITHGALELLCHNRTNLKATSMSFHLRANPINFFRRGPEGGYEQVSSNTYIEVFVRYTPPPSPSPLIPLGLSSPSGVTNTSIKKVGSGDFYSLSMSSSHQISRPSPANVAYSVKQRLESLEQIRHALSEAEYRDKRAEILDVVWSRRRTSLPEAHLYTMEYSGTKSNYFPLIHCISQITAKTTIAAWWNGVGEWRF